MATFIFFARRSYCLVLNSKKLLTPCFCSSRVSFTTFTAYADSLQKSSYSFSCYLINFANASNPSSFLSYVNLRPHSTSCSDDSVHAEKIEAEKKEKTSYESDKEKTSYESDVVDIDEWDSKYDECEEADNSDVWETLESNIEYVDVSDDVYDWEADEGNVEAESGDGGDGGGVVLNGVPWGQRVLSIARELLTQFGEDMEMYAFKASPRGFVYIRLEKLSEEYGRPTIEELDDYSAQLKARLDKEVDQGAIAEYLAVEVSSPGALRILKVPRDVERFKAKPLIVSYVEDDDETKEKVGFFNLHSTDEELETFEWALANVRENREANKIKGRPLSAAQKRWRLTLPFKSCKRVLLYTATNKEEN